MNSAGVIPERVGPYRPLAVLGQGGMGVVYRAEHVRRPGLYVALKVILESAEMDTEETRRRFERETRLLEGLRHPNIVSFLEVGLDGHRQYFAMELLEGQSLATYIGRPCRTIAPLLIQVCRGLHYLASCAVVHRDLSPGNILIVGGETAPVAKILDFGIAKDIGSNDPLQDFTRTGVVMGKPRYWSPEQLGSLGSSKLLDWRSDIYTLGVIFFQLFSGRLPFVCESHYQFASAHLFQPAPPLEAPPDHPPLPEALRSVVARMLAKSPDERPEYREIVEVLAQVIEDENGPTVELVVGPDPVGVAPDATRNPSAPPHESAAPFDGHRIGNASATWHPRLRTAAGVAAIGVPVLAVVAFLLARRVQPPATAGSSSKASVAAGGTTAQGATAGTTLVVGSLNIDAVPWARVDAIVDESTGRRIPVGDDLTTPVSLEVPPGRYRVEIVSGMSHERRTVAIDVRAGGTASVNEAFGEPRHVLALLD